MELLFTKPLSDLQIVLAKFFAALILLTLSLLPTLVYYYSVYQLGFPKGNIDTASVIGSYIGLLLLGSAFISIGLFASSISSNQIISFIVSVLLSGGFFMIFDLIYDQGLFGSFDMIIKYLGIHHHYISISRGVLDTRDLIYFLSLVSFFIILTMQTLKKRG